MNYQVTVSITIVTITLIHIIVPPGLRMSAHPRGLYQLHPLFEGGTSWSRLRLLLCPTIAARGTQKQSKTTSAVPPSNKGCDDFIILFSCKLCFVVRDSIFVCEDWQELPLFTFIQNFPPFFQRVTQESEVDTKSCVNLWLITGRHHTESFICKNNRNQS